jgi:uncharacterized protein (TIGR04255 family)
MGEPLKSQPLVEALCELQFNLSGGSELILPGLLYAQVRDEFPIQESVNEFIFQLGFGDTQGMQPVSQPQRLQLKRKDGSAMLQIGQSRLIINHLQPYISWEDFRLLILKTFTKYIDLCGEFTLKRIGLRYINNIIPPSNEGFEIDDFLTVIPVFLKPLDKPISGFQQSYEFIYNTPLGSLVHRSGVVLKPNGETVLLLDLDFISEQIENLQDNSKTLAWLNKWLDDAHDNIEKAFISSLNPSYYESLK